MLMSPEQVTTQKGEKLVMSEGEGEKLNAAIDRVLDLRNPAPADFERLEIWPWKEGVPTTSRFIIRPDQQEFESAPDHIQDLLRQINATSRDNLIINLVVEERTHGFGFVIKPQCDQITDEKVGIKLSTFPSESGVVAPTYDRYNGRATGVGFCPFNESSDVKGLASDIHEEYRRIPGMDDIENPYPMEDTTYLDQMLVDVMVAASEWSLKLISDRRIPKTPSQITPDEAIYMEGTGNLV